MKISVESAAKPDQAESAAELANEVEAKPPPTPKPGFRRTLLAELPRGVAEALGWLLVGLSNAVVVALLTPERTLRGRLLHHGIDIGQFALAGCIFGLAVWFWATLRGRFALPRLARIAIPWAILSPFAYWAFREDLGSVLLRVQAPSWLPLRALLALATAAAYLIFRQRAGRLESRLVPWASGAVFLVLVLGNIWLVPPDYPGSHLFVSACSARAGALFVWWLLRMPERSPRQILVAALVMPAFCVLGVVMPPSSPVWRSVLRVPSSAAAPFVSRLLASKETASAAWMYSKYPEWMRDRSNLPDVPAQGPSPIREKPLVILLTVDSLRADVLMSGENDAKYPALSAFRNESVCFTRARVPGPATLASLSAVFLGKYYSQIYWSEETLLPLEDTTERWVERLTKNGIHTINISALRLLRADQGIVDGFAVERITGKRWGAGSAVVNHLFTELESAGDRPTFAYAHFMDIHAPYNAVTKRGSQYSRYLAEVTLVDKQIARLRQFLTEKGLADRTLLILSADHGEAFQEHGAGHHGNTTYDEVLLVPLCFQAKGLAPSRIDTPVTLIDLGPTILDVFALPAPGHIMGQTLLPLLAGKPFVPKRPIAAEAGRRLQSLVFPDGIKVHRDPIHNTVAVYDLKTDPGELNDLNGAPNAPYSRYTAGTAAFFEAIELKRPGYEVPWRKW